LLLEAQTKNRSDRRPPRALALLPAGLTFLLYLATCSPTVNFTDSGELITVAWTWGIAHPPGYPLYTMLGGLWIHLLPFGNPAWRMNILSALFAALAVGLFYGLVTDTLAGLPAFRRLVAPRTSGERAIATVAPARSTAGPARVDRRPVTPAPVKARPGQRPLPAMGSKEKAAAGPPRVASIPATENGIVTWIAAAGGLAAAGLLATSLTFWNWATQAKMYTLHYAFMVGLLWLALRTRRALLAEGVSMATNSPRWPPHSWSPAIRWLHLLALTTGLALTNHYLTFLLLPGIAVLLLAPAGPAGSPWRRIFRHTGTVAVAGLAPLLLYLYLPLRSSQHPLRDWGSPDNWGDFWRHVTAAEYSRLLGGTTDFGVHAIDGLVRAANQFGFWLGILLLVPAGAGLAYLWRIDRILLAATILTAGIDIIYCLNYQIREIDSYYVPSYIIVLCWAGLGVASAIRWARGRLPSLAAPAGVFAAGAVLPVLALLINWGAAGHRNDYTAELYVRNAFKNLRPNAVFLTNWWDLTSASFYFQNVLGERTDVLFIGTDMLRYPDYLEYLERNYPDMIHNVAAFPEYKSLLRQWIDTGKTPRQLPTAYTEVMNSIVDTNLGQRPVYVAFIVPRGDLELTHETEAVLAPHRDRLVPDGFGYRIAGSANDKATTDPQFDLRGITDDRVPMDEVTAEVVSIYPTFLRQIGDYLTTNHPTPEGQQAGRRLLNQAAELQPLEAVGDDRPRLR